MLVSASEAAARTGIAETALTMIAWLRRHHREAVIDTPDGMMIDIDLLAGEPVPCDLAHVVVIGRGHFDEPGHAA